MSVGQVLRRQLSYAVVLLFLLASILPLLITRSASAYTLLGEREIRLSSSEASATATSYRVDFDLSTTGNIGGIVVTFCEGTPIIGDTTCVSPAGLSIASNAFTDGAVGDVNVSGWTAAVTSRVSSGSGDNTFTLTNAAPVAVTSDDNVVFTMTNVTNPSSVGTFYARIMTFGTEAHAQGYTVANPEDVGPMIDAGGIALSTADLITIQAKVQERITFCVHTTDDIDLDYDQTDCSTLADPVVLGDVNGVLDPNLPSVSKEAKYNITTNASAGATIRMKGDTLSTGPYDIAEIGASAASSSIGTEQFGMCTYRDTGSATGLTPSAPYNNGNCSTATQGQGAGVAGTAQFAFDTNATTGTTSTYGQAIAQKTAGDWSTGILVFLGNVSNVTEPGIYTTTLDFIATGRY
jgi:hypothetical protein